MGDNIESLAKKRAETSGDATKWSARDCLVEALRQIDNCEVELESVLILGQDGNGGLYNIRAGLSRQDEVTILNVALYDIVRRFGVD